MRPTLTPSHEADLRATMEALGSQPGGEAVWLSDNGRLLTSLAIERVRSAYWRAEAAYRAAHAVAMVLESVGREEEASVEFVKVGEFKRVTVAALDCLSALGEKP